MNNKNDEIIRLLKHGRSDEVRSYVNTQKKENYPEDFIERFLDKCLDEYFEKPEDKLISICKYTIS